MTMTKPAKRYVDYTAEFRMQSTRDLQACVSRYLRGLLLCSFLAGLMPLLSLAFSSFLGTSSLVVSAMSLVIKKSITLFLLYLFIGVFGLFLTSIALRPLAKRIKYTTFMKILFVAAKPMLFFSWIPKIGLASVLFSAWLTWFGIKLHKE